MVFCHGTPRDDEEVVLVDTRLERWTEVFAGLDAEVRTVVCGHTHMPFVRLVDQQLVINAGSMGVRTADPVGPGRCCVTARSRCGTLPSISMPPSRRWWPGSTYPDRLRWAEEYLRSANSDADALRAFGPRDGRVV